jgi:predicted ArsR family transcriptional regulator
VGAVAARGWWRLSLFVAASPEPVSGVQAATGVDMALHSVKFHLDRLVDEGLLDVEYRRLTGRTGPGAGRPSKLYRRADRQVSVSLPERRFELAGDLLAAGVERSLRVGTPVGDAVHEVARAAGVDLVQGRGDPGGDADSDLALVSDVLSELAYEPRIAEGQLCLNNCPFDRLAEAHTELVCGMNLSFVEGVLEGLEIRTLRPRLEPDPERCCVKVAG